MGSFSSLLERQGVLVLDGGLATELERQGESLDDPLWSGKVLLEAPEKIGRVNRAYLEAGADIVTSASYQVTFQGLQERGITGTDAVAIFERSVQLAISVRDSFWNEPGNRVNREKPLVVASVGPYGAYLHDGSEFRGDYGLTRQQLKDFHRERLAIFIGSGADVIACESVPSLWEAEALAELLAEHPGTESWISFTCKDGFHISDGTLFADAVKAIAGAVTAMGINCTAPGFLNSLLDQARQVTAEPLVVYPNSGEQFDTVSRCWLPVDLQDSIADLVAGWRQRGARAIGGCCRTGPETIRSVRSVLLGNGSKSLDDRPPSRSPA